MKKHLRNLLSTYVPIERGYRDEEGRYIVEGYFYTKGKVPGCPWNIPRATIERAAEGYMKAPAIREMHQMSAAGLGTEVLFDDQNRGFIRTHIVDESAIAKCETGVYRGFSLGAKPTKIRGNDIVELDWHETSLVDRPKDDGALFTSAVWRGEDGTTEYEVVLEGSDEEIAEAEELIERGITTETPDLPVRENLEESKSSEAKDSTQVATNAIEPVKLGCVLAYLAPEQFKDALDSFRQMLPESVLHNAENDGGFETDPHITVLFGLNAEVTPDQVIEVCAPYAPLTAKIGKLSLFKCDGFDVLKYDVEGNDFPALNMSLKELSHTVTHPTYVPHLTVAYVKPGSCDGWVDSEGPLTGKEFTFGALTFSDAERNKTQISLKAAEVERGESDPLVRDILTALRGGRVERGALREAYAWFPQQVDTLAATVAPPPPTFSDRQGAVLNETLLSAARNGWERFLDALFEAPDLEARRRCVAEYALFLLAFLDADDDLRAQLGVRRGEGESGPTLGDLLTELKANEPDPTAYVARAAYDATQSEITRLEGIVDASQSELSVMRGQLGTATADLEDARGEVTRLRNQPITRSVAVQYPTHAAERDFRVNRAMEGGDPRSDRVQELKNERNELQASLNSQSNEGARERGAARLSAIGHELRQLGSA